MRAQIFNYCGRGFRFVSFLDLLAPGYTGVEQGLYTILDKNSYTLRGHFQTIFLKISVIMTLSLGPPPPLLLASWQK